MTIAAFDSVSAPIQVRSPGRALWLIPLLALMAIHAGEIIGLHGDLTASLTDPDTLMRLARIKAALAGDGWQGGFFARDNAPYGMVLHWSVLFDLPIAGLALLLSTAMPLSSALSAAGALTGPLLAYGVLWATWWTPRPLLSARGRELACLIALLSPPILGYGAVGRANHHVALALAAIVLAGFVVRAWRAPGRLGPAAAAGAAAALCLWLSFELVAIAIFPSLAIMALLWVREGGARLRQNATFALVFAVASTAALALDPPHGGFWTFLLDRLAVPYVAFGWAVAGIWAVIALADRQVGLATPRGRLAWLCAASALAATALIAVYPAILGGVNGGIDPLIRHELNDKVAETQPSWSTPRRFIRFAYVGCLGGLAASFSAWRLRGTADGFAWTVAAILATGLAALGLAHIRFTPYAYAAAAFPLAALVERGELEWRANPAGRYLRTGVLVVALLVPFAIIFLPDGVARSTPDQPPCSVEAVRGALSDPVWYGATAGIIATDPDSATAILYWTPHGTLFGPYHRNPQGLRDLLALFRDPRDVAAQAIVAQRGIDSVLVCASRPADMFMGPGDTLYARLARGNPPEWLVRNHWPAGIKSGYILYRVDRRLLADS